MKVKVTFEEENDIINTLNFLLRVRHLPIISWHGGHVYPRNEILRTIRDIRRQRGYYKDNQEQLNVSE